MSNDWTKRFRYSLDPFLKKRKLDWAAVKIEEAQAKSVVDRREKEAASLLGAINEIEHRIRESAERGASIDRDQQQNTARYLKHTRGDLAEKRKQLDQASNVHEQIRKNLDAIRQGIKALEKHKTNKQAIHTHEALRRERDQLDELWLLRNGGRASIDSARGKSRLMDVPRGSKYRNGGGKNGG